MKWQIPNFELNYNTNNYTIFGYYEIVCIFLFLQHPFENRALKSRLYEKPAGIFTGF